MASKASIGGNPVHPMLIPFSTGLLVFSLIADLIYLWRGNPVWENYIAFYTLLGGIIGAAAAAVPVRDMIKFTFDIVGQAKVGRTEKILTATRRCQTRS
jgi:uncharacterized membrane protein